MKYSIVFSALSLLSIQQIAQALPAKRDGLSDVDILNFALTLEHLEYKFYTQGLAKHSEADFVAAGFPDWTRGRYKQMAAHEGVHVKFLTGALTAAGAQPVEECEYAFPDHDVSSFVTLSYALETVGASAYNGAAPLIKDKPYVSAAASILATEARHAAWINSAARKHYPWSSPFEASLTVNQAYTIASALIKSCPSSNPPLPAKAFPALSVPGDARPGARVKLTFPQPNDKKPLYAAFMNGEGTVFVPMHNGEVEIPKGLKGDYYVIVTDDGGEASDKTTVAGPALVMFQYDSGRKADF